MPAERISYRISKDPDQVAQEGARLDHLTYQRDPITFEVLERTGVSEGWRCLEAGAGSGTVTRWLSERVGERGSVLAVDVDTRFHVEVGPNAEVRQLDVTVAELGDAEFDLVHARALLQHLHQREQVLDKLVAAARPGGWVVVEDGDWTQFLEQEIPEPFRSLVMLSSDSARDRSGRGLRGGVRGGGLTECGAQGRVWTMHGGQRSAEWYVAALARSREASVERGEIPADLIYRALAQARSPDFAILSPVAMSAWGRRPA
ncbi:MAG: class I SAM-dependent methyltransferase [Proteobacteria bacterium]|nr:class I SAM-dependent methyltransferase [Pseudomonadota bacterium]